MKYVIDADQDTEEIYYEIQGNDIVFNEIASIKDGFFLKQPLMLMDPNISIPWDLINSCIYRMKDFIRNYPEQAKQRWNVIFGAYVPEIDYQRDTLFVPLLE